MRRDTVFISTKARTRPLGPEDGVGPPADRVRRSLAESLTRLGLDRVDVLFLHGPAPDDFTPSLMGALRGLKAEGLIGSMGVCGRGEELDAALTVDGFDLLMMPVTGQSGRLARAAARGIPVIAIETMRSRRAPLRLPTSAADLWYLARAGRDALTGSAPAAGTGIAEALALPAVASVVVQTTRLAHLKANAAAARQ